MSASSPVVWELLRDIDLLHIHQCLTYFGVLHASIGRSLGKTVIGTDLGGGDNGLMLDYGCIRLLDGVLSISKFAASLTRPYFRGQDAVVIGPVDTTKFSPDHFYSGKGKDVICVGRILPHKCIDRIIDALPAGLRLIVVGRRYNQKYYDLLLKKASGKDVVFSEAASDEDLIAIYRSAGLFVHAASFRDVYGNLVKKPELMGLTTIEAMSCGVPAVVSHAASLPELADDDAFFRTFGSTSELQQTLEDFRDGRWPARDASSRARQWASDRYGLEPVGAAVLEFYDRVRTSMQRGGAS